MAPLTPQVRAYAYTLDIPSGNPGYGPEIASYKLVGNNWPICENIKSIPSEVRQRLHLFGPRLQESTFQLYNM